MFAKSFLILALYLMFYIETMVNCRPNFHVIMRTINELEHIEGSGSEWYISSML